MSIAVVTGSAGLIGSEAVRFFCEKKFDVIGVDNNLRKEFFGGESFAEERRVLLEKKYRNYTHYNIDIRDTESIMALFKNYGKDVSLVVHAAVQPSGEWAAGEPIEDFSINAAGTLVLLENFRKYSPGSVFIYSSTSMVYGDAPDSLPLAETDTRLEIEEGHRWRDGVDEAMQVDQCRHGMNGASRLTADILVQEWGRHFGLRTGSFRAGPVAGAGIGARPQCYFSGLLHAIVTGKTYWLYGHKGKQVSDHLHSSDLVAAFYHFYEDPAGGEVYNIGGGRRNSVSYLEAIDLCQEITGRRLNFECLDMARRGERAWWVSGTGKFSARYPQWKPLYDNRLIVSGLYSMSKGEAQGIG